MTHSTQPVREQLLARLAQTYNRALTLDMVEFGAPRAPLDPNGPYNSQVEISSLPGQPYEFTTLLQFNRLSLEESFFGRPRSLSGIYTHTHELIPALRERLNLPVTEEDIVSFEIESVSYPQQILLSASSNSLLLYGDVTIALTGL